MTFWEILSLIGFGVTLLGAWLTASSYYNGERTRTLIRNLADLGDRRHLDTQQMVRDLLDRIDQRADERHRETQELIRTLRT